MLILIGLVLPVLIDLLNGKVSDTKWRFLISVLVCAIVGIGVNYVQTNGFSGYILPMDYVEGISKDILAMIGLANITYQGGYKDTEFHEAVREKAIDINV